MRRGRSPGGGSRRLSRPARRGGRAPRAVLDSAVAALAVALAGCAETAAPSGEDAAARSAAVDSGPASDPASHPGSGIVLEDAAGRTLQLDAPPRRIVSLVPAATAMLLALDARAALVGRTDFDTLAAVRDLPSVGDGLQPDLERLLALRPELVIRFEGPQDAVTGPALDARGIPHLGVRTDRVADVRALLLQLGWLTGREGRAMELVAGLDRELAAVRARVETLPQVRVAYLLGGDPPWVAGPDSYLADLLAIAGAENVFDDLEHPYAPVGLEELFVRAPDVVLVARGTAVSERIRARARVRELSPAIEVPGIGLGRSALELAELLHVEGFAR